MGDVHCWAVSQSYHWPPVVTFARRRGELLEWYDRHLEVFRFFEDEDAVGVEFSKHGERVTVDRSSVQIDLTNDGQVSDTLVVALDGVCSSIEPRQIRHAWSAATVSMTLDCEYEVARRALASGVTFQPTDDDTFDALDIAVLMDVGTPMGAMQAEFGVTNAAELEQRLTMHGLSRQQHAPILQRRPRDLPDVSLFLSLNSFLPMPIVDGRDGIVRLAEEFRGTAESLAEHMGKVLLSRMEVQE